MKTTLIATLCIAMILSVGMFGTTSETKKAKGPVVGKMAPEINVKTLEDESFTLEDTEGHLTLVVFWATWCGPCRAEIPGLKEMHDKYADKGLTIASISREATSQLEEFIEKNEMTWTMLRDVDKKAGTNYLVRTIPSMFLIAPDGKLLATTDGVRGRQMESVIEKHLHLVPKETLDKIKESKKAAA